MCNVNKERLFKLKRMVMSLFATVTVIDFVILLASLYFFISFNNTSLTAIVDTNTWRMASILLIVMICCVVCFFFYLCKSSLIDKIYSLCHEILYDRLFSAFIASDKYRTKRDDKIVDDIVAISSFIGNGVAISLFEMPLILLFIVPICLLSPICAVICMIYLALSVIIVVVQYVIYNSNKEYKNYVVRRKQKETDSYLRHEYSDVDDEVGVSSHDLLCQWEVLHGSSIYYFIRKLHEIVDGYRRRCSCVMFSVKYVLLYFCLSILFILNVELLLQSRQSVGSFIAINILAYRLLTLTKNVSLTILPFINARRSALRLIRYVKTIDRDRCREQVEYARTTSISLCNVGFTHSLTNERLLNDVSYFFKSGFIYVITSNPINRINNDSITERNSVNISALLDIISGECRPTSGYVRRNNANNEYSFMSYCPFEPVFISGRIDEIVSSFSDGYDDLKIRNMLLNVNLLNDVESMPDGIKTVLFDENCYSREFVKKLNIATTLFRNSNVVVLDEPFVLLDNRTINCVLRVFEEMRKLGKIIIVSCRDANTARLFKIRTSCKIVDIENLVRFGIKNSVDDTYHTDS